MENDCELVDVISHLPQKYRLVIQLHYIEGYCYRKDYEIWAGIQTPQEALKWQEKFEKDYPNGYYIPVYQSDGETQIGWFKAR